MRWATSAPGRGLGGGLPPPRVTPWVKGLLIANAAVFLVAFVAGRGPIHDLLAFSPSRLLERPWGLVTYMFVHAGFWHLAMNSLFLFFFGPPLERRWGSGLFARFYLICGLGGVLTSFAFSGAEIVGASAACYGLLTAFALAWPNQPVHVWGVFPVKVKWLVTCLVAVSLLSALGSAADGVAHLAHLGGAVAAFATVKLGWVGPTLDARRRPGGAPADWGPGVPQRGAGRRRGRAARRDGPSARIAEALRRKRAERATDDERAQLDRVDAVLDKISARGVQSLTAEERALLDRVSRRTRAN